MSAWIKVGAVLVAGLLGISCKQSYPTCLAPGTGTVPEPEGEEVYAGYEFRLVEKDGNVGFVGTSSKGRVVVIPLDPRARMFADGKPGTAAELLSFRPSTGGCPCRLPVCWPYCRVADPVLTLDRVSFWGSRDVPTWNWPPPP